MKRQSELEIIWPEFYHSADIEILDDYSRTEIKLIVNSFFKIMEKVGYESIGAWGSQAIFDVLDYVATETEKDGFNRQTTNKFWN